MENFDFYFIYFILKFLWITFANCYLLITYFNYWRRFGNEGVFLMILFKMVGIWLLNLTNH